MNNEFYISVCHTEKSCFYIFWAAKTVNIHYSLFPPFCQLHCVSGSIKNKTYTYSYFQNKKNSQVTTVLYNA